MTCELLRQLDRLLMYYGLELREDQTLDTRTSLYSLEYHGTVDFFSRGDGIGVGGLDVWNMDMD